MDDDGYVSYLAKNLLQLVNEFDIIIVNRLISAMPNNFPDNQSILEFMDSFNLDSLKNYGYDDIIST